MRTFGGSIATHSSFSRGASPGGGFRGAAPVFDSRVRRGGAAVQRAVPDRQDRATEVWRGAGGLEYVPCVFPGGATGGVRVCARVERLAGTPAPGAIPRSF